MAKPSTLYHCTKCDAQFPKWEGRCRECGGWGTLQAQAAVRTAPSVRGVRASTVSFSDVNAGSATPHHPTGIAELDRVLGGGLVPGVLILLGGDPGIGKSTLLLQVAHTAATEQTKRTILYVSGEESAEQVKLRLDRLGPAPANLRYLGEPNAPAIAGAVQELRPALVIVDSLQTLRGETGGPATKPSEARAAVEALMDLAKQTATPIILIGHVTKSGIVAGPKTLEHLVDVVLYFESAGGGPYRIIRAAKNRFGSIAEVGVFQMTGQGLQEVANPSAIFLADRRTASPGSAITALLEGSRIFLIEIQALVTKTRFGYPQRRATGFNLNRLQQLLAVLNKRLSLPLPYYDVHLNVVGGLNADEPAADLAVALAIISALKNQTLGNDMVIVGEVGLQGEVRSVPELERRLDEASRLGMTAAIVPPQTLQTTPALTITAVDSLESAVSAAL